MPKSQKRTPNRLEAVTVLFRVAERNALRHEAVRRVEAGETNRIDVSAIVRELVGAAMGRWAEVGRTNHSKSPGME